jgi:hypothetical protein
MTWKLVAYCQAQASWLHPSQLEPLSKDEKLLKSVESFWVFAYIDKIMLWTNNMTTELCILERLCSALFIFFTHL